MGSDVQGINLTEDGSPEMNPQRLLQHFERIAEAPDAVPRLRRFILDLAVRGKLVEQDPNDESAAELLKQIQAEKVRRHKDAKISKEKLLPLVNKDEIPFDAATGWEWVRIRQVTSDRGQTTPTEEFSYIDVTAIDKEAGRIAETKVLSADEAPSRARKVVQAGDVIYSCVRPYLLNIAIVESEIVPPPIASTAFAVLNGFGLVHPRYLWIALRSSFMIECVEARMKGQAYPAINDSDFALLPLPLPPLAEQHRIVAKVDELMALCDRLAAAQAGRENRRDRLAAASLHRLNNGANSESFREHARFHLRNLPRLTSRPEHIQQLRQTILNLAVAGRLVPQDPNDESAYELLVRIEKRKAHLLREAKIKKTKACRKFDGDVVPHSVPMSWTWTMLGEITDVGTGSTPSRTQPSFWEGGSIPWISSGSTSQSLITAGDEFVTEKAVKAHRLRLYQRGTLLVALYGQGKTRGQVATLGIESTINQACAAVCPLQGFEPMHMYLKLLLQKNYDEVRSLSAGGAQPNLNVQKIKEVLVPLPPLAEQHRIVAKVEELLALCIQLEAQLTDTQFRRRRLVAAVLQEALSSCADLQEAAAL